MEKRRRSVKKVNYAAMEDGQSDCEDFLPATSKKKRTKECIEILTKTDRTCANKGLKKDVEVIDISRNISELNSKSESINVVKDDDPMPGTSWGLTAKRQRKQINCYNEGQQESSDDFEGWNGSSEESDFSSASPIINKRKINKENKRSKQKEANSRHKLSTTVTSVPPTKTVTENHIAIIVKRLKTAGGNDCSSVESKRNGNDSLDEASLSDGEQPSSNEQTKKNRFPASSAPLSSEQNTVASPPALEPITNAAQLASPVLAKTNPSTKDYDKVKQSTREASSKKTPTNIVNRNETAKTTSSPMAKSSFKSPVTGHSPQIGAFSNSSSKTGLRLGLSRKGNYKSLHPKASVS